MKLRFPFGERPRVKYRKNPLVEVVCQFQFPKLLRLEAELPADFQDAIKADFPQLRENTGYEIAMQLNEEQATSPAVRRIQVKSHDFISDDGNWTVGLGSSSISLSCQKYNKWEEFDQFLRNVYQIFIQIYNPAYISRCGLRYINVIDPLMLGLAESDFAKLISADLVGEWHKKILGSEDIRELGGSYSIALSSSGHFLRVNYGLVKHPQQNRHGFKIDGDFWVEGRLEASSDDINQSLAQFNRGAGSLFRGSIENDLHQALGPEEFSQS